MITEVGPGGVVLALRQRPLPVAHTRPASAAIEWAAIAAGLKVADDARAGAGSVQARRDEREDTDRHRARILALAPDFDQRNRVAPVEHRGVEVGNAMDAAANVHETLAVFG